jgi:hypothetical protein
MEGHTDPNYERVAPRDLFNEAKLLKCLGQLALLVLDKGLELKVSDSGKPFKVGLHDAGYLTAVSGISFKHKRRTLWLGIPYNSRANYPLICHHDYEDIEVFNTDGSISEEFELFMNS